jgi:acetylornithine/succinyldiaminopimelate/putrescine aminotransferase
MDPLLGGNPIAAEVAMAALEVVKEEGLAPHARALGEFFRSKMNEIIAETDLVTKVRGKGLLNAILINDTPDSSTAWEICVALKENGLLAKPYSRKYNTFCTSVSNDSRADGRLCSHHSQNAFGIQEVDELA